ncbi:MAG: hypothetical protein WEB88_03510 [Gemmatimonadota bacterium]
MPDDRYDEEQAAAIFTRAAEAEASGRRPVGGSGGMTLQELQEIGREAGLSPEAVAEAAASLRPAGTPAPTPTFLRIPIGVARTVPLQRPLSDEEWGGLVAELRDTFNAGGTLRSDGTFREWRNGNLRVHAGPAPGGYQVEMRTSKGSARSLMTVGGILGGIAAGAAAIGIVTASGVGDVSELLMVGGVLFGVGVVQVPIWARRRKQQFENIARRLNEAVRS